VCTHVHISMYCLISESHLFLHLNVYFVYGGALHVSPGWRPSEALTVSTVAFHQTLSEVLLHLARCAVKETDTIFAAAV